MRVDLVNIQGLGSGPAPSLLSEWRVGAILEAIAVRDARGGQLWLDIGGHRYPARIASGDGRGPEHGERLQVRVLRDSPVLALETLATTRAQTQMSGEVVADALRRYVPRQESPALLLANLGWIAQGKSAQPLPKAIAHAAAQLWQALPDAETLTDPDGLQTAVRRSGAFLEANLASSGNPTPNVASDLKALMLQLHRALQTHGARPAAAHTDAGVHSPVPNANRPLTALPSAPATLALVDGSSQQMNELSRQTEGALARLTTTQIANSAPEASAQSFLVELPVRHDDRASVLRLRVERDGSRQREGAAESWTVEAAMDLGAIGALHAKVTFVGKRIGVQLRAESPAVVDALAQRAGQLETMLRSAGLEIDRVVCLHGMPAGDIGPRPTRLLDVRA